MFETVPRWARQVLNTAFGQHRDLSEELEVLKHLSFISSPKKARWSYARVVPVTITAQAQTQAWAFELEMKLIPNTGVSVT